MNKELQEKIEKEKADKRKQIQQKYDLEKKLAYAALSMPDFSIPN